ncbi:hypothetical protein [Flavilitoribacter nigricans]|uniref:Uncharacterized protein n=1 Tax=Flavilitoribacter nigricans (strain ATCC 23147 / DSM 23189 / NBRC 102662 / NCIMB 1420 / SS-2) TaxID=1122177 RepID=A0A2D0NDX5_FLAN2|nr:hypothetical protein [Flavilitoribacter nigricans]PHN06389.1 hypothetical protein CRP01_12530 [Flavilitoribacter nigricans DSM 23189 = NBRC 102662]
MEEYLEKNKSILTEAIARLPVHRPPTLLWKEIEGQLEQRDNQQAALRNLPQHAAPPQVWEQIEQLLDQPQAQPAVFRVLRGARPWIAAATLCGLALGTWWFLDTDVPAKTSIAYAEEQQIRAEFAVDWDDEAAQIAMVLEQVETSPVADPQAVQRLKLEFDELTDARTEVEDMLKRYGEDESLLKEVARIERERSQVIKELATWI